MPVPSARRVVTIHGLFVTMTHVLRELAGIRDLLPLSATDPARYPGLLESAALPEPRFTPATKAESGHDENISRAQMRIRTGAEPLPS